MSVWFHMPLLTAYLQLTSPRSRFVYLQAFALLLAIRFYQFLISRHLPSGFLHTAGPTISLAQLKVHSVMIGRELFGCFQILNSAGCIFLLQKGASQLEVTHRILGHCLPCLPPKTNVLEYPP